MASALGDDEHDEDKDKGPCEHEWNGDECIRCGRHLFESTPEPDVNPLTVEDDEPRRSWADEPDSSDRFEDGL